MIGTTSVVLNRCETSAEVFLDGECRIYPVRYIVRFTKENQIIDRLKIKVVSLSVINQITQLKC